MKKGQLIGQPIIYIFYALVAAMILFLGVRVIFDTKDTGDRVEFESFVNDVEKKVNTAYQDSYGSRVSLDNIRVPKQVIEVCFVGNPLLDNVNDPDLRGLISVDSENNVFFGGVDIDYMPARDFTRLVIDGTICDETIDRKINLVLENVGTEVKVTS